MGILDEVAQYPIWRPNFQHQAGRRKPRRWRYQNTRVAKSWSGIPMRLLLPMWEMGGTKLRDPLDPARSATFGAGAAAPTWAGSELGPCLRFDGTNDEVSVPDFNYGTEWTISFWLRIASNVGNIYHYFFSHGVWGTANSLHIYGRGDAATTPNNMSVVALDSNDTNVTRFIGVGMLDGRWHMVTVGASPRTGLRMFRDGRFTLADTARCTNAINPAAPCWIGRRNDTPSTRYVNGWMANMFFFGRMLTDREVLELYKDPWAPIRADRGPIFGYTPPSTPSTTFQPMLSRRSYKSAESPSIGVNG